MEWKPKSEGLIVLHKLLGKTIIVRAPENSTYWDIRMRNGEVIMVDPAELEEWRDPVEKEEEKEVE